jgi:tight adherence protein B
MSLVVSLLAACGVLLVIATVQSPRPTELNLRLRKPKRQVIEDDVWPDVVDDVASAIRAGLSLPQAVCELTHSSSADISAEFQIVADDYLASGNFTSALAGLRTRHPDPIVAKFVDALTIAYEVGGSDLGVMLRALAEVIRDDVKLRGEIEARQSWTINGAKLAVAAPWITVLLLSARSDAARVYQSAAGIRVLMMCAVVTVVAYVVMQRVGRLPKGAF